MTVILTEDLDLGTKEKVLHQSKKHVKYEGYITHQSKVIANGKVYLFLIYDLDI